MLAANTVWRRGLWVGWCGLILIGGLWSSQSVIADQGAAKPPEPKSEAPQPADNPSPKKPTPEKPVPEKPVPEKPAPEKPAPDKPAPAKPAESKPAASKPGESKSGESKLADEGAALSVEKLTEQTRNSVVIITVTGRDGKHHGLGSGFVIDPEGLIATNMHVIGEGRPIVVQLADGKKHEVTAIHAFDRHMDLAIIRVNAKNLPALPLGDAATLKQGQPVIALGNPLGLKHSVVAGVVSGMREIEGRPMIQLAIPIEPGNSGGPVIDMQGRVHGIITMKSAVTQNLGFAVSVTSLKGLIAKPNTTAMSRWLTIGALDPQEWTPLFGARWRQRAGRILVEGLGDGFGGRSVCLSHLEVPQAPFEVAVTVKLDHEEGAAGLVFCADGQDKHYGFYPTNGKLRLTRFDGSDVFSWKVLQEESSQHYKAGDWNTLRVKFEKGKIECFVNDQPVIQSTDTAFHSGKVGLAKFRQTQAEFKGFAVAKELRQAVVTNEIRTRITTLAEDIPLQGPAPEKLTEKLAGDAPGSVLVLRERAKQLEQQAAQLRQAALLVHQQRVCRELAKSLEGNEEDIDLFQAALLVARLDNDEVDVASYQADLARMARGVLELLPKDQQNDEAARLAALDKYLFQEHGFHGSRGEYYHKSNSYVNEVLDDGEGLPITLSVIYLELARRIGLKAEGVGLPGHFVVRYLPKQGDPQLIDVFEQGKRLTAADAANLVRENTGRPIQDEHLAAATKKAIISRILYNLMGLTQRAEDPEGMLRYVEALVAINSKAGGEERWMRAVLRFQTGRRDAALDDCDWLLEHRPAGVNLVQVQELRQILNRPPR